MKHSIEEPAVPFSVAIQMAHAAIKDIEKSVAARAASHDYTLNENIQLRKRVAQLERMLRDAGQL